MICWDVSIVLAVTVVVDIYQCQDQDHKNVIMLHSDDCMFIDHGLCQHRP